MATQTLLQVVNTVMRRARLIDSVDEILTDFDDDTLRVDVDIIKDAINDTIRFVYDTMELTPYGTATNTIILVEGQREYTTASDFHIMASGQLKNLVLGHRILEYPGGYKSLFEDQDIPSQYTGQSNYWVINPDNDKIRLDTAPPAERAGDVYTYIYTTQLNFELTTDILPMTEMSVRDLIPAMVQMYKREADPERYDEGIFLSSVSMGIASIQSQRVMSHHGLSDESRTGLHHGHHGRHGHHVAV